MEANLSGGWRPDEADIAPEVDFPPSNWGPAAALFGVLLALVVGGLLGVPAIILGQQSGGLERVRPGAGAALEFDSSDTSAVAVDRSDAVAYALQGKTVVPFDRSGRSGSSFGHFDDPEGIAVDAAAGRVYVSDGDAGSISALGPRGRPLFELPGTASPDAGLEPGPLAVGAPSGGRSGDLYVIDRADDAVVRLSPSGREMERIGREGGPFDFDDGESAVAVGASGDVYVLGDDRDGERSVWAFDGAGRRLWRIDAPGDACGLTVGSNGDLWVADPDSGLNRFALGGRPGERPRPAGEPVEVADLDSAERCGLASGRDGDVYVATDAEYLSTTASVFVQLGTVLGFLIVPLVIAGRGGAGIGEALRRLGLRRFRVLTALKWMAAAIGVYLLFAIVYSGIFGEPEQEDIAESFGAVPVQVLLIVFAAAVSEEVCFRGMLFGGLRERLPMLAAGLLSGVVFGALHALTGLSAVPPLIAFGLVMAVLYEKTGSIVPGILLHMLNNSAALLAQ